MSQILLLNASDEPLAVIGRRKAFSLIMRQCVIAACEESVEMQSVSRSFRIPTVIRLRYYVNVPRRDRSWSRRGVLQRDRYVCAYCGVRRGELQDGHALTVRDFTIDHVLPVSRGGGNTWSNTVCACWRCNQHKADRTPHEAKMPLRWEPKTPRVNYLVASGEIPAAWRMYFELAT
jgi:5-methylcytosine-specific restriction endonuclease McrA